MTTTTTMSPTDAISTVADRAHNAINRASEQAAPALNRASDAAHRTIDKAVDAAAPAAEWVTENGREWAARSGQFVDNCSSAVRARPLATVAGALVLGYLAGKLMR